MRQNHIARHLEEQIADEEDAGAPAEDLRGETQILVHRQRSEANIDAVEKADGVERHHERDQPPRAFGEYTCVLRYRDRFGQTIRAVTIPDSEITQSWSILAPRGCDPLI